MISLERYAIVFLIFILSFWKAYNQTVKPKLLLLNEIVLADSGRKYDFAEGGVILRDRNLFFLNKSSSSLMNINLSSGELVDEILILRDTIIKADSVSLSTINYNDLLFPEALCYDSINDQFYLTGDLICWVLDSDFRNSYKVKLGSFIDSVFYTKDFWNYRIIEIYQDKLFIASEPYASKKSKEEYPPHKGKGILVFDSGVSSIKEMPAEKFITKNIIYPIPDSYIGKVGKNERSKNFHWSITPNGSILFSGDFNSKLVETTVSGNLLRVFGKKSSIKKIKQVYMPPRSLSRLNSGMDIGIQKLLANIDYRQVYFDDKNSLVYRKYCPSYKKKVLNRIQGLTSRELLNMVNSKPQFFQIYTYSTGKKIFDGELNFGGRIIHQRGNVFLVEVDERNIEKGTRLRFFRLDYLSH